MPKVRGQQSRGETIPFPGSYSHPPTTLCQKDKWIGMGVMWYNVNLNKTVKKGVAKLETKLRVNNENWQLEGLSKKETDGMSVERKATNLSTSVRNKGRPK